MMQHTRISAIAAIGENRELGKNNGLLWHIPDDLKRFKSLTNGHPIIMGRKTWDSLPFKPLPNRTNIVISRMRSSIQDAFPNVFFVGSIEEAKDQSSKSPGSEEVFIIGGGKVFEQSLPIIDRLYLTIVHKSYPDADVYFPEYAEFTHVVSQEDMQGPEFAYTFLTLDRG